MVWVHSSYGTHSPCPKWICFSKEKWMKCLLQVEVSSLSPVINSIYKLQNLRTEGQGVLLLHLITEATLHWRKDGNKSTWFTYFCLLKPWNYFNSLNLFALNMYLGTTGWTKITIGFLLLLIFLLQLFIARMSEQTVWHPPITRSARPLVSMTTQSE